MSLQRLRYQPNLLTSWQPGSERDGSPISPLRTRPLMTWLPLTRLHPLKLLMLPIHVISSGKTFQHESFGDINTSALILERLAKLPAAG